MSDQRNAPKKCESCGIEFNWEGVDRDGVEVCSYPCARGETGDLPDSHALDEKQLEQIHT